MSDIQGEIKAIPKITGGATYPRNGESAYQIALNNGFIGTEEEWLASLKGESGKDGLNGKDGYTPIRGTDYWNEEDIDTIERHCDNYIDSQPEVAVSSQPTGKNEKVWFKTGGKNLINVNNTFVGMYNYNDTGVIGTAENYISIGKIEVRPNTTYTFSADLGISIFSNIRVVSFRTDGSFISRSAGINLKSTENDQRAMATFTTSDATYYIAILVYAKTTPIAVSYIKNWQLEEGTEATTYEPYVLKSIFHKEDDGSNTEFIRETNNVSKDLDNISKSCVYITGDLDTACNQTTGFFKANGITNSPASGWVYILNLTHNANYERQIAFDFFNTRIWSRVKTSGTWGSWSALHS